MQAIVLAAGEGSRMRPLTSTRPKVMLPVGRRPLLEEIVHRTREAGVDRYVFVVGYQADSVRSHFGDGHRLGVEIEYARQAEQLGTGHALAVAEDLAEERFLVLNGDVLPETETLRKMVASNRPSVAAKEVDDPRRYGVFLAEGDLMKAVVEKSETPPTKLANAGLYLLGKEIFDALREVPVSDRGEYELTDGLNRLATAGREIEIVEMKEWTEVGRPWDLLVANEAVLKGSTDLPIRRAGGVATDLDEAGAVIEEGAVLLGPVYIGKGTRVRSGSYIEGPVAIGKGCDIGPNCYIRPATSVGNDVRIGNAVEVKNSVIMDGTKIGHLSYLGDSVVGRGCNFGAGTIVSNLRHDDADIRSYVKGEMVDSKRRKLGVIMGDGVKTGIHTTVYPGTVVEPGFRSRPGEVLRGHVGV